MNYEERIEWFWKQVLTLGLDSAQIALWFCLLHKFKQAGFPTRMDIDNDYLCRYLSVEIRTLRAVRKRLIDNRLIAYEAGNAKRQPAYIIDMELYASMHPDVKKEVKVKQPVRKAAPRKKVQKVLEPMLFKPEKQAKKKADPEQHTLEDVTAVCVQNGMSVEEAKKFFYYYDAQGWVTSSGQKIKRVDSMVNRWLNNGKKEVKNGKCDTNSGKREERNKEIIGDILARYSD